MPKVMMMLILCLSWSALESRRTITISAENGTDKITFDATRLREDQVRHCFKLSPHVSEGTSFSVPEQLQLCVAGDPDYRDCATRNWKAKNFIYNATVNLGKIRERMKELDEGAYPPELRPVVSYFKKIQEDNLFFDGQLLEFIQEWRIESLEKSFGDVDPGRQCSAEITKLRTVLDKDVAFQFASKEWRNCVNHASRVKEGSYPEAAWQNFLQHYSIREEFTEDVDE